MSTLQRFILGSLFVHSIYRISEGRMPTGVVIFVAMAALLFCYVVVQTARQKGVKPVALMMVHVAVYFAFLIVCVKVISPFLIAHGMNFFGATLTLLAVVMVWYFWFLDGHIQRVLGD